MYTLFILLSLYSSYPDLIWKDFEGEPDSVLVSKGIVAHTETLWALTADQDENGRYHWDVLFSFAPKQSWTITDCPYVLGHENTHYRISQLWYNKFKKVLPKYQNCDSVQRLKLLKVMNQYWHKSRKLQALYDRETQNGQNKTLERIWEKNIKRDTDDL